jgi:hypothetical protein
MRRTILRTNLTGSGNVINYIIVDYPLSYSEGEFGGQF